MNRYTLASLAIVAILLSAVTAFTIHSGRQSQLYAGDKLETRTCRWCNGSGIDQEEEGPKPPGGCCPGCNGSKQVEVVLPGPKHPRWVKGTVQDQAALPVGYQDPEAAAMEAVTAAHQPMQPVRGAVPEAKITFEGPGGKLEVTSARTGRFRCALPPGVYNVKVSAPGFSEATQTVEIGPLQHPIWNERANLVTEEKMEDIFPLALLLQR